MADDVQLSVLPLLFAIEKFASLPGRPKLVSQVSCLLLATMETKKRQLWIFIVSLLGTFHWVFRAAADTRSVLFVGPRITDYGNNCFVKGAP